MPAPRVNRSLLFAGAAILALFAAGTFLPRNPESDLTFGLEAYRSLGAGVFLTAGIVLALLLALPGPGERLGSLLATAGRRIPAGAGPVLTAVLFGAAAWLLPNHALSGDAGTVLLTMTLGQVQPSNALTSWLLQFPDRAFGLDPVHSIRLVSVLSGVVYAWCATALARECAPPGPRRAGVAAVLLTTGAAGIFFGTIEVYAPVVAGLSLYLLLAIRDMKREGRGIAPALVLGVAFCLHGSAALLLPTLLLVANRGRFRPLVSRRLILAGAAFLLPLLLTGAALYFGTWGGRLPPPGPERTGTFLGTEGEGPFLPLRLSPHAPRQRYAILDPEHAVGMLNLLILLAPVGIALFLIGRRPWKDPAFRLVAASAILLFLLANIWNVSYSLRRDWDLFSTLGPPCALLGALAWFGRERTAGDVVRVAALSVFATLPFVVSNSVAPEKCASFGYDMSASIRQAVPTITSREVVRVARERASRLGVTATRIPEDIFWGEVEIIVRLTLQEHGVLEQTRIVFDSRRFREVLTGILAGKELPVVPGANRERLAQILSESLEVILREAQSGRGGPTAPGALAVSAVQSALSRPEILSTLGVRPGGELPDLALLDAMDEAMESRQAFSLALPYPDSARWEPVLVENFRILARQFGAVLSPEGWGSLTRVAIAEVVTGSPAELGRRRWARLQAGAEEWAAWAHRFTPPGLPAAVSRAEWISAQEGIDPAVRYAVAERYARHGLERLPGHPAWLSVLAGAVYLQGRHEEAEPIYRRAIRAQPEDLDLRVDLAIALQEAGRTEEALAVVERGVRVAPWHRRVAWALAQIADLRLMEGDSDIARSAAECALKALDRLGPAGDSVPLRRRLHRVLDWPR